MIDINTFLTMLLYILGSVALVALIILIIKLISTVNRLNVVLDDVDVKIKKFDNLFRVTDVFTDNLALISDKLIDGISYLIRKIFNRKEKRKEDELNEQ